MKVETIEVFPFRFFESNRVRYEKHKQSSKIEINCLWFLNKLNASTRESQVNTKQETLNYA